jgi:membrane-bound lytic murein transglycosylase B
VPIQVSHRFRNALQRSLPGRNGRVRYTTVVRVLIACWCVTAIVAQSALAASAQPPAAPLPSTPAPSTQPSPVAPTSQTAEIAPSPPILPPVGEWLDGVRTEAIARGISPETVSRALADIEPVPQILERDRAQAEFTLTMKEYLARRLTRETLKSAKASAERHRALLARVHDTYGVQPRFLVAVWGLESNFGRFAGVRPMIPTLATLAYEPRRAGFFRQQLFDALVVLDRGYIELARLNGSWAGAMGQPQFMPSSYLTYAQDFDGDGRRDIWDSQADVFASIAYYLQHRDWEPTSTWGRRVHVPATAWPAIREAAPLRTSGCRAERQMSVPLPLAAWRKLGVRRADKRPLPEGHQEASLVETDEGEAYLVYANYEALLGYNCAHTYALSVSLLADALDGIAPLPTISSRTTRAKAKPTSSTARGRSRGAKPKQTLQKRASANR